jgi:hypothetical protein
MQQYAPSELQMWEDLPPERSQPPTDSEINEKYAKRELRIVTETNREQLPNFESFQIVCPLVSIVAPNSCGPQQSTVDIEQE